jgi:hypothetical protein
VGVTDVGTGLIEKSGARPLVIHTKSAALVIDQVLKGITTDQKSVPVTFDETDTFVGYRPVASGTLGIFFLKQAADHYTFTSPYYPFLRALPGTVVSGEALEGIASANVALLQSTDVSPTVKGEAIYVLRQVAIADPEVISALRTALADKNRSVRACIRRARRSWRFSCLGDG